jgi:hypothetical protein
MRWSKRSSTSWEIFLLQAFHSYFEVGTSDGPRLSTPVGKPIGAIGAQTVALLHAGLESGSATGPKQQHQSAYLLVSARSGDFESCREQLRVRQTQSGPFGDWLGLDHNVHAYCTGHLRYECPRAVTYSLPVVNILIHFPSYPDQFSPPLDPMAGSGCGQAYPCAVAKEESNEKPICEKTKRRNAP